MRKLNKLTSGFTVIEILLYMGIFSILLVVITQIFTLILSTHLESQATSAVDQDANFIMARLTHDIHEADSVVTPPLGSSGSTLHIIGSGIDETYALSGTALNLTSNGSTDQLNSINTDVTANFTTIGNSGVGHKPSVKIVLTVTSKSTTGGTAKKTETFETTVDTR